MSTVNAGTLNVTSTLNLPSYTKVQRDALSPTAGQMIYNSTDGSVDVWDGTQWKSAIGSSEGFIQASGGTESTSGDYKIHTFNTTSSFTVNVAGDETNGKVDYLVVACGGGGGGFASGDFNNFGSGGGGGAGGMLAAGGYNYTVIATA